MLKEMGKEAVTSVAKMVVATVKVASEKCGSCMRSGCHRMDHKSHNCTRLIFRNSRCHSTRCLRLLHWQGQRTMHYSREGEVEAGASAEVQRVDLLEERTEKAELEQAKVAVASSQQTPS